VKVTKLSPRQCIASAFTTSWFSSVSPSEFQSNLILSTHLRLGLPSGLFASGFPTNILHACLFSPIRATCPAHLTLLDLIILIKFDEEYKLDVIYCCKANGTTGYHTPRNQKFSYPLYSAKHSPHRKTGSSKSCRTSVCVPISCTISPFLRNDTPRF
jgi:hypothetical protein